MCKRLAIFLPYTYSRECTGTAAAEKPEKLPAASLDRVTSTKDENSSLDVQDAVLEQVAAEEGRSAQLRRENYMLQSLTGLLGLHHAVHTVAGCYERADGPRTGESVRKDRKAHG